MIPSVNSSTGHQDTGESSAWRFALLACALAFGVQAGFASLSDPDLPNHLSLGEWMLAHRGVPFVEPFAWTRAGQPFYAYSWMAQLALFSILRAFGPTGLHVLNAVLGVAITLASATAARALGARGAGPCVFGVASAMVAFDTTPFLRPQLGMFVLVPLAWACVAHMRRTGYRSRRDIAALLLLNVIAAGVHISFPVMATPLVLIVLDPQERSARSYLAMVATLGGWLVSPYAMHWPEVFRLNFARNAITTPPAPTGELTPGFLVSPLVGVLLAAIPVVAISRVKRSRERLLYGAMWLAGLWVFGRMFKGLGPWWWCATPLAIIALEAIPEASGTQVRSLYALLLSVFVATLAIPNVRLYPLLASWEGDVHRRTLPGIKAFAAEPAAQWLEQHTRTDVGGRLLTTFNFGSYLHWRLPMLSESIDGRTIFPDSAAMPDAIGERGVAYEGPWRSADVAIVPVTYPSANRLDADSNWIHVGLAERAPWAPKAPQAGLWIRRAWWRQAITSNTPEPPHPLVLRADALTVGAARAR